MGLEVRAELSHDESVLLITDWGDKFTVTLTPKYGRERIREEYSTFPKAMDRFSQMAKHLQKEPYNWVALHRGG